MRNSTVREEKYNHCCHSADITSHLSSQLHGCPKPKQRSTCLQWTHHIIRSKLNPNHYRNISNSIMWQKRVCATHDISGANSGALRWGWNKGCGKKEAEEGVWWGGAWDEGPVKRGRVMSIKRYTVRAPWAQANRLDMAPETSNTVCNPVYSTALVNMQTLTGHFNRNTCNPAHVIIQHIKMIK